MSGKKGYVELDPRSPPTAQSLGVSVEPAETKGHPNAVRVASTKYGECEVVILGDRKRQPVLVTYPDVGCTFDSCTRSFVQFCGSESALSRFCQVHVSPPGMYYGAGVLETKLSMTDLKNHLVHVLKSLEIDSFHGFAVGMGGYLMLSLASESPSRVQSLVLVNPTAQKQWWIDWAVEKSGKVLLDVLRWDRYWKRKFISRWFHPLTIKSNTDLVEAQESMFFRANSKNVKIIASAFSARSDILSSLKSIKARTLLLVADGSVSEMDCTAIMGAMPRLTVEWAKVKTCGVLMTEERPAALLHPMNLFYAGLGIKVSKAMLERSRKLQTQAIG